MFAISECYLFIERGWCNHGILTIRWKRNKGRIWAYRRFMEILGKPNSFFSWHGECDAQVMISCFVRFISWLKLLKRNDNAFQMKEYTLCKNKLGLFVFVFRFKLAVVTFVEAKQRVMDSLNVFKGIVFLTNQNEYVYVITVALIIKKLIHRKQ